MHADALARLLARPIAHRGLHACGGDGPVENTIAAAEAAIAGAYGIECDVQLSRDGCAFVFHDDALSRLTGTSGLLREREAAEIADLRLADGSGVPDLPSFLAVVCGRAPLFIEVKSVGDGDVAVADVVLRDLQGYSGPIALESFDPRIVSRCRDAPCPVGLVGPADHDDTAIRALPRCDFVSWRIDDLGAAAHRLPGLPRTAWTVRDARQVAAAAAFDAQIVFEGLRP